ncbi:MAG: hypothetical protein F6K63_18275 [Moorea sp. SIO1G6]|uniref:hypothetical protein n=1 Tax=Moorena sp. SIO1G6 TaxID=2607840 RepID=UPI0013BF1BB5|nr:hypothetical protein [Moorena sp. SIO1G6]NET66225.1 hypothetical protein [Moorena sp. SIO1G6]
MLTINEVDTPISSRFPTPDSRLPTPDSLLPTPYSLLPTPYSLSQITKYSYLISPHQVPLQSD